MIQATRLLIVVGTCSLAVPALGASLSATTTTLSQGDQSDGMVDVSVFPGAAGYGGIGVLGGSGAVPFTPMGDGTVVDYAFYNDDNVTNEDTDTLIAPFAAGGAGVIGEFQVTNGPTGGGTRIRDDGNVTFWDLWESTDPALFAADNPDFNGGSTHDSAARVATAEGEIDLSIFDSGTVYVFYGTFQNDNEVTATLSGPGQADLVSTGGIVSGEGLSGNDRAITAVTAFTFTTDDVYDTLTISYEHADQDSSPGSRARFAGVVIDGVIPEPNSAVLFTLASLAALRRRWLVG